MVDALGTLREHHVQVLTVGQYLRPTENHLPIVRYWHPDEFKALEKAAYELGFEHVAAGPLVRCSYHADQHVAQERAGRRPARGGGERHDAAPAPRSLIASAVARARLLIAPRRRSPAPAVARPASAAAAAVAAVAAAAAASALYILFQLLFRIALLGHGLGALVLIGVAS